MPNHVTNKLLFPERHAATVKAVFPNGFDFEVLVPPPPHVYWGNLSSIDEHDFPINWESWSRANWGTKWNCYDVSTGIVDGLAWIKFDTAWQVPYPVISAFNNRFQIPFEHRYACEGHNFWGVEVWGLDRFGPKDKPHIVRTEKRYMLIEAKRALYLELKGYDIDKEDDDEEGGLS